MKNSIHRNIYTIIILLVGIYGHYSIFDQCSICNTLALLSSETLVIRLSGKDFLKVREVEEKEGVKRKK